MSDTRNTFSKSLKKRLTKKHRKSFNNSIGRQPFTQSQQSHAQQQKHAHRIEIFNREVKFPYETTDALGDDYSKFLNYYIQGIEIHNNYIAGNMLPIDFFEIVQIKELSEFQNELYIEYSKIAKQLAYKKRRESLFKAFKYLQKNVLLPLDSITFSDENYDLNLVFEHAIDLIAQCFICEIFKNKSITYLNDENIRSLCKSAAEYEFLKEIILLYNVSQYFYTEAIVDSFVKDLSIEHINDYEDRERKIFDIYELIPLYIKSWDPTAIVCPEVGDFTVSLMFDTGAPCFVIHVKDITKDELTTAVLKFIWTPGGQVISSSKRDLKSQNLEILSDYFLNLLHDELLEVYMLRSEEKSCDSIEESFENAEIDDIEFINTYHVIIKELQDDFDVEEHQQSYDDRYSKAKHHIPSLRLTRFTGFMKNNFKCSVEQGKGSEIKIWRKGTKIYTIGKHKNNDMIPSFLIIKIIKRLGITKNEWLRELNASIYKKQSLKIQY
jgi:hypothetical protein